MRKVWVRLHSHLLARPLRRWDVSVRRYVEVAASLGALQEEGLVRHIGLTNFALEQTREIVEAGVAVASTQVQLSLLDRRAEESGLCAYCAEQGIGVLAYGSVAGGLLSDRYLGAPPPADEEGQQPPEEEEARLF